MCVLPPRSRSAKRGPSSSTKREKSCSLPGSNWRPSDYETDALPTEPKERQPNPNPSTPSQIRTQNNTTTTNNDHTTTDTQNTIHDLSSDISLPYTTRTPSVQLLQTSRIAATHRDVIPPDTKDRMECGYSLACGSRRLESTSR